MPKQNCRIRTEWTYPKRHTTSTCDYIDFYARDPFSGEVRRKKISLEKYRHGRERDEMAGQIISQILDKLHKGWNPFAPESEDRRTTPLIDVIDEYVKYLKAEVSRGSKREKTFVDYSNRLKHFKKWACFHNIVLIGQCDTTVIENYLEHRMTYDAVSARTRNNDRTFLSAFFTWCTRRHYIIENPCSRIGNKKTKEKIRKPLSDIELARIKEYLSVNDRFFLLAVYMVYYSLIRPKELSWLRLSDIDIENQVVVVPDKYSKNRCTEPVGLNSAIVDLMIELNIFKYPRHYFVFGYEMRPSEERRDERQFRERWNKLRDKLNIPRNRHFYSLKDSGIIDLLTQEGVVVARDQARHHDVRVTNLYSKYGGKHVHEVTKHFKGKL